MFRYRLVQAAVVALAFAGSVRGEAPRPGDLSLITDTASAGTIPVQDISLSQTYGEGVHAYFSGRYTLAHQLLTEAIDTGLEDPRCYYFRGLTFQRLGRPQQAEADLQHGAELEAAHSEQFASVSKALERIQGSGRLHLEALRREARRLAFDHRQNLRRQRYQEVESAGEPAESANVSDIPPAAEEPAETPPANGKKPAAPADAAAEESAEEPAEDPADMPAEEPAEGEAPADKPASDDPFDAPTEEPAEAPADAPAEDADPFGDAPAGEPTAEPAEEPASEPAEEPAAEEDPFDAAPADEKAAPAEGMDESPIEEPAADEPAAEEPATEEPAAEEPATEEPADANKPAAADDDPFADTPK